MENTHLRSPGRPEASQAIGIQSKFIGPGGVRSDRKSLKSPKITFFALFGEFPPRINNNGEILKFSLNLAKRVSLGGPARRSLFFLRNIKVSEPPEYRKMVRNGYSLETSWNFMKLSDFPWFVRNFHILGNIHNFWGFGAFGVLPGSLKTSIIL